MGWPEVYYLFQNLLLAQLCKLLTYNFNEINSKQLKKDCIN